MQGAFEGCSPERPGRLLEPCGNARPRWMVVTAVRATGRGTEPGSQAHLSTTPPRLEGGTAGARGSLDSWGAHSAPALRIEDRPRRR